MNGTGSLLQKSIRFLWRNPIILLPMLVVRLVDFVLYWFSGLIRLPAMKAVAPRSVLGGISGNVDAAVLLAGGFFTFLPLVCEVALLVYGMVVSGRWAHDLRQDEPMGERSWRAPAADVARVALLTLCVGGVTAAVGLYFTLRGGVPVRWSYLVTWCFLIMATWFVLPSWLRLLAQVEGVRDRDNSKVPPFIAMTIGLIGFAVCVYLGADATRHLELAHRIHKQIAPFAINVVAALVSAVPLAFGFTAMSRYVAERPGWNPE